MATLYKGAPATGRGPGLRRGRLVALAAIGALMALSALAAPDEEPQAYDEQAQEPPLVLDELKRDDPCASLYIGRKHGYQVDEYQVRTRDNYLLTVHRIRHPGTLEAAAKPYLLVHGLVGSSASFVRNLQYNYAQPEAPADLYDKISLLVRSQAAPVSPDWQSSADLYQKAFEGDESASLSSLSFKERLLKLTPRRKFMSFPQVNLDSDETNFGRNYRQAYRRFDLPIELAKTHSTNSLAITLANFGYDVWLANLRGNWYSRRHAAKLSPKDAEFWDFDVDTVAREDLPATIEFIRSHLQMSPKQRLGLVSFSYASFHTLNMLSHFRQYQATLQPVVLVAPTLMTGSNDNYAFKYLLKSVTKLLVSNNGPFPAIDKPDLIERLVCKLPLASKLCNMLSTLLHGEPGEEGSSGITSLMSLGSTSQREFYVTEDAKCGATSTTSLHQIIKSLSTYNIGPKFKPSDNRLGGAGGEPSKRTVLIVHSQDDQVATVAEVAKIRDSALRHMTLAELLVVEPKFRHMDFLFSERNQYLINAEIARAVAVFDYMNRQRWAHEASNMRLV